MPQMTTQSSDDDRIDCFVVHVLAHTPSLQSDPLSEPPDDTGDACRRSSNLGPA